MCGLCPKLKMYSSKRKLGLELGNISIKSGTLGTYKDVLFVYLDTMFETTHQKKSCF